MGRRSRGPRRNDVHRRSGGRHLSAIPAMFGTGLATWLVLAATISIAMALPSMSSLRLPALVQVSGERPGHDFPELTERFIGASFGLAGDGTAVPMISRSRLEPGLAAGRSVGAAPSPATALHVFDNDDFARAFTIEQLPFTAMTETTGASRQPGEPDDCAPVGGTAWYRYTPTGTHGLFAHTFGSRYPLVLGAYEGEQLETLRPVACSQGVTGNAQVGFLAKAGTTYHFQISGVAHGGTLAFSLERIGTTGQASVPSPGATNDRHCAPSVAGSGVCAGLESEDDRAPVVSGDGRYIAFQSRARHYDADRHSPRSCLQWAFCSQIYVHDRITGVTELVSRSSSGEPGNSGSYHPSMSHDGRYVAFSSYASNLVPGDTNNVLDVFVLDRLTGIASRESVSTSGQQAQPRVPVASAAYSGSAFPSLSADGRHLTYSSDTENLTGRRCDPDSEGGSCWQIHLRDRRHGTTRLVSVASDGTTPAAGALHSAISPDGSHVAFVSSGDRLVRGAQRTCTTGNGRCAHVYLKDLATGRTVLVDASPAGEPGNRGVDPWTLSVSAGGRFVAFLSQADNLVANDTNAADDAFVVDTWRRLVDRVSVSSSGAEASAPANADGTNAATADLWATVGLSHDGRYVAFASLAPNLVPDDTNGQWDIFLRDRHRGTTVRVSLSSDVQQSDGYSIQPRISADGSVVAFTSDAANLGPNQRTRGLDVYYHVREPAR